MKKNKSFKLFLDFTLYGFILLMQVIFRRLSRRRAMNASERLGEILYRVVRGPRMTIEENLNFIYNGNMTQDEIGKVTRKIFSCQVKNQIEMLIYRNPKESRLDSLVSVNNLNLLDDALKSGNGVLLLSAHMGDMSMGVTWLAAAGYQVSVITRALSNRYVYAYMERTFAERHVDMIQRGEESKQIYYRLLAENKILATAVDQHAQEKGITISFMGKPAQTACGWVILAKKSGARVLMVLCVREDNDRHRFFIEDPLVSFSGDERRDLYDNTVKVNKIIESYVYKYPEQWFWMHKRWRTMDTEGKKEAQ